MRAAKFLVATAIPFAAMIWFAGCSDNDPVSSSGVQQPTITSVSPADEATGVAISTSITLRFDVPMDPQSVMANFYFAGGNEMHEWMDALADHHGRSMLGMNHMMDWIDRIHLPGEYHWNDTHDLCEFVPESGLSPETEYMVFIHGGARSHDGRSIDTHHTEYGGLIYRFRTAP